MKALYFALGLRVVRAAVFLLNPEIFQQCLIGVFAPFALGGVNKSVIGEAGLRDAKACDGRCEAINNDVRSDSIVRGAGNQKP